MEGILNVVLSIVGGVVTSLFTTALNGYLDKKKFVLHVCEFVEELALNRKAYSKDAVLIKLQNFDTQICSRFNRKIKKAYEKLYGDIVQCLRLNSDISDITEYAIFESYNNFLQSVKFYLHRRYYK